MKKNRLLAFLTAAVMVLTMMPVMAFAEGSNISNIEWWNFRNNEENNGVTDRETPTCMEETTQKWSHQVAPNYTDSCTPPLILDGYLYTAQERYVYKLDKETGVKVATSVKLDGQIGYAMNPIVYADGKLFIQINNGRVQALDAVTLESLWVSEEVGGQTLSPITYKNGYIYTSTWESETKDGAYFCINTKEDPDPSTEARECEWIFVPSQREMGARGFYWAGSYASDNYVAFGTDDGDAGCEGSSYFVTVDPVTGEIIDKLSDLDGDIRTTTVYHGGYLYFASKGGTLYKVSVDDKGVLGTPMTLEMEGMMTAAPVVHNGRIYIGVCGQGGQFDKDGGHCFAVVNDEDMSLAYKVDIQGYPQAAALLSTAADENGNGKVYMYFTYNSYPGGIYFFTDTPGQTEATDTQVLFEPPVEQQQYCISTISCDAEGTLYYKNDSGYLMAVTKNRSYVKGIDIKADNGEVRWSKDFNAGFLNYDVITEAGVQTVDVTLDVPEGMDEVTVDGVPYEGSAMSVALDEKGEKELLVIVKAGEDTRTYTLNIRGKGSDATLTSLVLSKKNGYSASMKEENQYKINPVFDPIIPEYNTDVITTECTWVNLWPKATESTAKIEVYPVENVLTSKNFDSEEGKFEPIASDPENSYYKIYPTPGETDSKVKIKITSESGNAVQEYTLTIVRDASVCGSSISLDKTACTLSTVAPQNEVKLNATLKNSEEKITWISDNEDIATVSEDGTVTALSVGTATISASIPNGSNTATAKCEITVIAVPKAPSSASANLSTTTTPASSRFDDIKFSWKASEGATGYLVYYKKGTGSWSSAVSTKNTSYTKKNLSDGVKYTFKVIPYYESDSTKLYSAKNYKTASVYTLKKLAAPTVSKSGTKVKVKWKNINGETGYQISKSTKKSGTNIVSTYKTTSGTYKKVSATKGKNYYYKVRAYKVVNGKKIYGPWSSVKVFKRK